VTNRFVEGVYSVYIHCALGNNDVIEFLIRTAKYMITP